MRAGDLRHRMLFQKLVPGVDPETQEPIPGVWVDVVTVSAAIEPLSARDFIAARAVQSEVVGRIVIRRRTDIDASMRGVYRGQIYSIKGVLPDPKSGLEYLTLPYAEGVNDG
ncbi:phage head closure protein [Pseudomonas sp. 681]|uniref:Phage head closure protein n=1 Tax=Pseudomonas fungipugnans TaxID=3024217 RepID=A0ABT6QT72_9PSED|nr:phage head closure protein [Pseudomonas sp. 681]MDI2594108.1 phage head closure protein [Pseudomonas sp. 681]